MDIYCGAVDDHLNEHGYIVPVWAMPVTGSSGQNKALSLYVCDARQAGPVRRKGAYHGPRADERQTARPQPGHDGDLSGTDSRAALVIARMVKFRSQVDVTLPAVLWEDGEATAVNTTLHFHGEMVKQWGQDDSFSGYLELEEQPFTSEEASKVWLTMAHEGGGLNRGLLEYGKFPAHTFFGELYTDREYTQFFLFPFERVPGEDDGTSTYVAGSSVYVAPAASLTRQSSAGVVRLDGVARPSDTG